MFYVYRPASEHRLSRPNMFCRPNIWTCNVRPVGHRKPKQHYFVSTEVTATYLLRHIR